MKISGNMKVALRVFLESNRATQAILIGTRRTDPYAGEMINVEHLQAFQPTDGDWPSVMRVHPILEWSYQDIWHFIQVFEIPYCELYDQGYTSLGSMNNTFPNPALKQGDHYLPAYLLEDGTLERAGRQ